MSLADFSKGALLASRLLRLPFVNRRGFREVTGVALGISETVLDPEVDVLPLPKVTLEELIAEESEPLPLRIHAFPAIGFSISLIEAVGLSVLMRKVRARRAFEFGTHRGVSTSQLAANLQEGGEIFTLDLPRSDFRTKIEVNNAAEKEVAAYPVKADLIPANLRGVVRILEQDSAVFDPTPYRESMDFVFIDAAHTAEYVQNDSEKAWLMLRPGGIVAWHDCRPQTPDVVRYLRACPLNPRRIVGTTLAFAVK